MVCIWSNGAPALVGELFQLCTTFLELTVKGVEERVSVHRIPERLDAVDKMTRYCGYPSPGLLCAMIIKLYKQMSEIRVHSDVRIMMIVT